MKTGFRILIAILSVIAQNPNGNETDPVSQYDGFGRRRTSVRMAHPQTTTSYELPVVRPAGRGVPWHLRRPDGLPRDPATEPCRRPFASPG